MPSNAPSIFPVIEPVLSLSPSWFTEAISAFLKSVSYLKAQNTLIPNASSAIQPSPISEIAL